MGAETRERIVESSAELFRRRGYSATGIKQIVAEARAPFGSIYHFFPGGKEELGAEVLRWSGARYEQLIPAVFDPAPDVVTAVRAFFRLAGEHLRESGWVDACPIATVTLETASESEAMRAASADVFSSWTEAGAARFAAAGIGTQEARSLALALLCALEGAFVFARAWRTTEPLDVAGETVAAQVAAALDARAGG